MASRIYEWLDSRLKLKSVEKTLLDEPIPGGASWIYVFGSATLFLFVLQAVTGMFLAVYYAPDTGPCLRQCAIHRKPGDLRLVRSRPAPLGRVGDDDCGRAAHAASLSVRSVQAAARVDVDGRGASCS